MVVVVFFLSMLREGKIVYVLLFFSRSLRDGATFLYIYTYTSINENRSGLIYNTIRRQFSLNLKSYYRRRRRRAHRVASLPGAKFGNST